LTSSVPNLELDTFAIKLNGSDLKVNANGGDEASGEGAIRET